MSMSKIKSIGMGAGIAAVVAIGLVANMGQLVPSNGYLASGAARTGGGLSVS